MTVDRVDAGWIKSHDLIRKVWAFHVVVEGAVNVTLGELLRGAHVNDGDTGGLRRLSVVDAAAVAHVDGDDDEFPTVDVEDHAIVAHSESP